MPPLMREWLSEGHLAYFISDAVDAMDISEIEDVYERNLRGYPPYHPRMMAKVLFYAYCTGVFSARKMAKRLEEDVAFRVLAANNQPDFRTLSDFRKEHLCALGKLFKEVLMLCKRAGMVRLGHVALDGTKQKANASKHKAMSYGRMKEESARLDSEISELLATAARVDEEEDAEFGRDVRGDELPDEMSLDAGYYSDSNVAHLEARNVDVYMPPCRLKHREYREAKPEPVSEQTPTRERMKSKVLTEAGRAKYGLRKETVEPVFGQIKRCMGFREFSMRGLDACDAEWSFVCAAHNLLKLFRHGAAAMAKQIKKQVESTHMVDMLPVAA